MRQFMGIGSNPNEERTMRYSRKELLEIIQQNYISHMEKFAKAKEEFSLVLQGLTVEIAEKALNIKDPSEAHKFIEQLNSLRVPNHEESHYKRAIKMLELSQDDDIYLSQEAFAELVMDDWFGTRCLNESLSINTRMAAPYRNGK